MSQHPTMSKKPPEPASVAVVGAGAIGGYVAARLALAGVPVQLCVRKAFTHLLLDVEGQKHVTTPRIATDPSKVARARWVFLATKAHDSSGAALWLKTLCDAETTLVVLQNGLDHAERLTPLANGALVLPAVVQIGAERLAPGHILQHGGGLLVVPAGDAAQRLATILAPAQIAVEPTQDFVSAVWKKILGNIVANPITALTLRRVAVFREPAVQALSRALVEEAMVVGRACGASFAADEAHNVVAGLAAYNPEGGTSMLYDRLAGQPLEHEHLTGAVVQMAAAHGIAVPLNSAIYALLGALNQGLTLPPPIRPSNA
jgi:2-dehydropantoate 2-reductase